VAKTGKNSNCHFSPNGKNYNPHFCKQIRNIWQFSPVWQFFVGNKSSEKSGIEFFDFAGFFHLPRHTALPQDGWMITLFECILQILHVKSSEMVFAGKMLATEHHQNH
jgi:hypothetical protein